MVLNIKKAIDIKTTNGTYLIYGPPGTGKTSTVRYAKGKSLVLDVDRTSKVLKGLPNIDIIEIDNIATWEDWENTLTALKQYKGQYQNIIVDNISELERCLLSDLGNQGSSKQMGVPTMGNYQHVQFRLVNSLRWLKELEANVIMTAWEMTDLYTASTGQQFNRSYPQIGNKIMNNIAGLCDVVARLMRNKEGERGFILSPTDSIYAKNQLDNRVACLQSELFNEEE